MYSFQQDNGGSDDGVVGIGFMIVMMTIRHCHNHQLPPATAMCGTIAE